MKKQADREKIQILLRCIAAGDQTIYVTTGDNYIAAQCATTSLIPKNSNEKPIIDRLKFELYGEFPLSIQNENDWKANIEKLFVRKKY